MAMAQTPTSSTYRMANRLVDGRLAEIIAEGRTEGLSWDQISQRLYESGVEANGETLRQWAKALGIDAQEPAA